MALIDLSMPFNFKTPVYEGDIPVLYAQKHKLEEDGYNAVLLTTGLHTGTHVDAPLHFLSGGKRICDFPLDSFCGDALLLDVRGQAEIGLLPGYEDLVRPGQIVLLHTGWSAHAGDEDMYFKRHPTLDKALTAFFCEKKIKMLGMDMPSPDRAPFEEHKALLGEDILLLENLTNLSLLPVGEVFRLAAFPLPLDVEASLVRAVAEV